MFNGIVQFDKDELKHNSKKLAYGVSNLIAAILKIIGTVLLVVMTTGAIAGVLFAVYINQHIDVDFITDLGAFDMKQSSFIYYTDPATGRRVELESLHDEENRVLIPLEEIPESMIEALVAIEDKRFWDHKGVDWKRTSAGLLGMFGIGPEGGGSTLTQQLIKNSTQEKEGTVQRKINEILRALELEKHVSKEQILERYLNLCYFGQNSYGIQAAAHTYFGKDPMQLTIAEQASIIGITNAPTRYDPYQNPTQNKRRQETILVEMFEQGYLDKEQYAEAMAQELVLAQSAEEVYDGEPWSYFVDEVVRDVTRDFADSTGLEYRAAQIRLFSGGFNIYATMDPRIQGIIDDVWSNEENWPVMQKRSEKPQSSMVLVDITNGNILGMAGGRGIKDGSLTLSRATQTRRQPGSSMKPVAAYAPAIDAGILTPYAVLDDAPLSMVGGRAWPRASGSYSGRMTVLEGITRSVNTTAVRALDAIGPQAGFNFAKYNLHIDSLVEERWLGEQKFTDITPSLALGGLTDGATVREMTQAYAAFPNRGVFNYARSYTHVTTTNADGSETVVLSNDPVMEPAMKESTAYYINTALQNAVRAGTGSKARLEAMPAAGKTGTTTADKDRWFCGYTPYYAAAVWFGFDLPKKIALESSTNPALHMWKLVMDRVHEGLEEKDFFTLEGLKTASYCKDSGLAPTENCKLDPRGSRVASGTFAAGDVPTRPCTVHTIAYVDSASGHLCTPYCPEETKQRVALLSFGERKGIDQFGDSGYLMRTWTEANAADPREGELPYNAFCPLHRSLADMPLQTPDPNAPFDPNNPFNPLNPYDPLPPTDPTVPSLPLDPNTPTLPTAPTPPPATLPPDPLNPLPENTPMPVLP